MVAIFAAMLVSNLLCIWLCLTAAKFWSRVTMVPPTYLSPAVFALSMLGTYSLNQSFVDVGVMLIAGIVGFTVRRFGYSPVPLALGLLLGGLLETTLK